VKNNLKCVRNPSNVEKKKGAALVFGPKKDKMEEGGALNASPLRRHPQSARKGKATGIKKRGERRKAINKSNKRG